MDTELYPVTILALPGIPLIKSGDDLPTIIREAVARAKRQLKARLVFENDSVTNLAHQLGYFETVVGPGFYPRILTSIENVTPDEFRDVARRRLTKNSRTVGWFRPLRSSALPAMALERTA